MDWTMAVLWLDRIWWLTQIPFRLNHFGVQEQSIVVLAVECIDAQTNTHSRTVSLCVSLDWGEIMKIYEEFERDRFEHGRQQTITKWRFEFQWKEQNFFFWTGKKYLRNIRRKLNRERMGWDYKYGFDTGQTFYIYKYSVRVRLCEVRRGEVRLS